MTTAVVPEVFLRLDNSSWPNQPDLPIGTGRCTQFSVEREIVSGALPGQIRSASGFSIGSGSAEVAQSSAHRPFTPWASEDRAITVGMLAALVAVDTQTGSEEPLGAWKVASASGALDTNTLSIPLAGVQAGTARARLPIPLQTVDPIWIIDMLARQAGYFATPPPAASSLLDLPLIGGIHPIIGSIQTSSTPVWDMSTGGASLASTAGIRTTGALTDQSTIYLTLNVAGFATFRIGGVDLRVRSGEVAVRTAPSGAWSVLAFPAGECADWPLRVQVEIWTDGTITRVRARSCQSVGWSTQIQATGSASGIFSLFYIDGGINGLQVTTRTDPILFAPPNAVLSLLDGLVFCPWVDAGATIWEAIQQVTQAFAGAGFIDRLGVLKIFSRTDLTGAGRVSRPLDLGVHADSLKWSIADDDHADRLVVEWSPPTAPEDDEPIEWAVGMGRMHVPAGTKNSVLVDLGGFYENVYGFTHYDDATGDESTWEANTAADGTGIEVREGVVVSVDKLSPSAVIVTVENATLADIWMVDYDGSPALVLRGSRGWMQDESSQIARGTTEADSTNPLSITLGPLAQDPSTVASVTNFLWERCRDPQWRIQGFRIPLDLTIDIGDVLALSHTPSGLTVDALVTRMQITGSAGNVTQTVDLVALSPVVATFDAVWGDLTVTEFDAINGTRTVTEFDRAPLERID